MQIRRHCSSTVDARGSASTHGSEKLFFLLLQRWESSGINKQVCRDKFCMLRGFIQVFEYNRKGLKCDRKK